MKKLLLIPALLSASLALAKPSSFEISPMIGYDFTQKAMGFKQDSYSLYALELQYNPSDWAISPELSVLYSGTSEYNLAAEGETTVTKVALSGVYSYESSSDVKPFAKLGVGRDDMDNAQHGNSNGTFFGAGAGAKILLSNNIAVKFEGIYNVKRTTRWDSDVIALAGLSFTFGAEEKKSAPIAAAPVETPVVVAPVVTDGDNDGDGVANSIDKCPNTKSYTKVNANGCKIDGDDDKDGILNSVDRCPSTPANAKVNGNGCEIEMDDDKDGVLNDRDVCPNTPSNMSVSDDGCPKKITLRLKFSNASYAISKESYPISKNTPTF